jgi:hypothetical protein
LRGSKINPTNSVEVEINPMAKQEINPTNSVEVKIKRGSFLWILILAFLLGLQNLVLVLRSVVVFFSIFGFELLSSA